MVTHVGIVPHMARLPIQLVVSCTGKMNISLSSFALENMVFRDGFSSPVPRKPAHLQRKSDYSITLGKSFNLQRHKIKEKSSKVVIVV